MLKVILLRNGCQRQRQRHLHARLLVSDPEYLLHRLLALRLDKLPCFIRHCCSYTRKCESAVRRARPGSPRVFEPLVELIVPHLVARVCGPASPGLRRVLFSVPPSIGCQRHRHEDICSFAASLLPMTVTSSATTVPSASTIAPSGVIDSPLPYGHWKCFATV